MLPVEFHESYIVYYKGGCPYSQRALRHLKSKQEQQQGGGNPTIIRPLTIHTIEVTNNPDWKTTFENIYGIKVSTVPQIVCNGRVIGGCTDLEKEMGINTPSTYDMHQPIASPPNSCVLF